MIRGLGLSGFFLLHFDLLELAREVAAEVRGPDSARRLLPPGRGRGSSVSSVVCYLTGLSHVDPVRAGLFLGRFLNDEITEMPDIDLDFPRDIREQLIPRVHDRYGRERAALVSAFASYRSRGAVRDLGKALGPAGVGDRARRRGRRRLLPRHGDRARRRRGDRRRARVLAALALPGAARARGLGAAAAHLPAPGRDGALDQAADRHLPGAAGGDGGPPGGPVGQGLLRRRGLSEDRPARPRDAVGGRALRRADRRGAQRAHRPLADPARRPADLRGDPGGGDDRRVPDREPGADADAAPQPPGDDRRRDRPGGARAAGADPGRRRPPLPRAPQAAARGPELRDPLRAPGHGADPRRHARGDRLPGSGDPGGDGARRLRRRRGRGAAAGDEPQALRGGAERLRRALRRRRDRAAGSTASLAERVFEQVRGFSGFGFPKSHAAAFGLLAYQSTWLRVHYGPELLCALFNEQPMGFYPPDTLTHEAQRRGIEIRACGRESQRRGVHGRAESRESRVESRARCPHRPRLHQGPREGGGAGGS